MYEIQDYMRRDKQQLLDRRQCHCFSTHINRQTCCTPLLLQILVRPPDDLGMLFRTRLEAYRKDLRRAHRPVPVHHLVERIRIGFPVWVSTGA